MKFTISWDNYPNCSEATAYSKMRSYIAFFLRYLSLCLFIVLLIGFFGFVGEYWANNSWLQYFGALFCLFVGGVLAHLIYVLYPRFTERGIERILLRYRKNPLVKDYKEEKKDIDKFYKEEIRDDAISYYFYFIFVALIVAAGCILINSFIQIGSNGQGIGWLVFSICVIIGLIIGFKYIKDKYIWF